MENYIKEFISKLQRSYETDSMQYDYSVLEIPAKDLTTEVTTLLTAARKKWLEEEIVYWKGVDTGFDTVFNYGFRKFIQDQISRLEAELKALDK